jgi:hypothetical protein
VALQGFCRFGSDFDRAGDPPSFPALFLAGKVPPFAWIFALGFVGAGDGPNCAFSTIPLFWRGPSEAEICHFWVHPRIWGLAIIGFLGSMLDFRSARF